MSWGSDVLVEESVVMDFLVVVECLDFLVLERKSLNQTVQCQIELWQVLVDDVLDLDFDWGSEVHSKSFQELQMGQILCQNPQMFGVKDFLLVEGGILVMCVYKNLSDILNLIILLEDKQRFKYGGI